MKILHCISGLDFGGAERQLSYLAPELVKLGHEVHVAFLSGRINLARLKSNNVQLHNLSRKSNYDPRIFISLCRLIHKLQPDIIQTWIQQMDILGGLASLLLRKTWVIREPSTGLNYNHKLKNILRKWIGKGVDGVISNSRGGDLYWLSLKIKGTRYIIPNAFPIEEIEHEDPSTLAEFDLNPDQRIIVYTGRMDDKIKNVKNLFYSLLPIVNRFPVIAILCGEGPDKLLLRELINQNGVSDKIILPGFITHIWPLMKKAELFISLSNFEGCPNTVIEAMACGCPLIVSDIPAHHEILDEKCAFLVPAHDPIKISNAIKKSLLSPAEAKNRARFAKDRVMKRSVATMAREYEEAFENILSLRIQKQGS